MTDKKFTDEEIIKAVEVCAQSHCRGDCEDMGCPASTKQGCYFYLRTAEDYEGVIQDEMLKDVLALIKRQRAEIERLKNNPTLPKSGFINLLCGALIYTETLEQYNKFRRTFKSEAVKEFAERLNRRMGFCDLPNGVVRSHIDHLVKEMTEESTE